MSNRKMIFIDCDGVLCDFVGAVRDLFDMPNNWVPAEYDFIHEVDENIPRFWLKTSKTENFWKDMDPLEDGLQFCHEINRINPKPIVVPITQPPPMGQNFYYERTAWLRSWFVGDLEPPIFYSNKSLFSCRNILLIDDKDSNVDEWRAAGGTAILWPRPWNSAKKWGVGKNEMQEYIHLVNMFLAYNEQEPEFCECGNPLTYIKRGSSFKTVCDKCGFNTFGFDVVARFMDETK